MQTDIEQRKQLILSNSWKPNFIVLNDAEFITK